ncbi:MULTISPECIES: hypothetical protein [Streptomyces]|uniref:hypothetical protein n=1 Tax=Streptomyces TaxID=1883 RepID=UPI00163C0F91|nr:MULTISPECIES: hypothetical protein [Streptomyces]MBC2877089.1 hypothetical protein [Streptomyces sp. TYQ1024]UBI39363.1 hypothetical protein K7I03_24800 [Streptomyces mobaraensis]UKW31943.1 hypothetical protein MCU78_24735 [Streptomyces sp. TYQ1024]
MDISAAPARALRAALFTALCVLLSTSSHVLLSGRQLPAAVVAAVTAGVYAAAWALYGRERGYGRTAALLVPLELAASTVFTTGQHTCYDPAGRPLPGALTLICGGGEVGGPLARVAGPGTVPWLLLAGHLAAGLLATAWLARGEAALGRLVRAAGAAAFRPLRLATARTAPAARVPAPTRPAVYVPRTGARPLLLHSVIRRGPPAQAAPA